MTDDERVTVMIEGAPQDPSGMTIVDLIRDLQSVLAAVPEEFLHDVKIKFFAYDWEGVECSYERAPSAEEIAAAEAIFADRAKLIECTPSWVMAEWLRNVRLKRDVGALDAAIIIRNEDDAVALHPKYHSKTRIVTAAK